MSVGKIERNALPYSNVVAAGQATSQITVGKTLNNYQLNLGGTAFTKAMIDKFVMRANGKAIIEASGTQIDKMMAYRGITSNAAFLDIAFEDITGLDQLDRMIGSLDTSAGIQSLTTEVDIAGATAPTLTARLHESAPQRAADGQPAQFAGMICKYLRYGFNVAGAGELPLNFPFGPVNGAIIKRAQFFLTNDVMTGITVKEDSIAIHESTLARNEYEQRRFGRVPQANMYTVDFVLDGNMRNAFDTRKAKSVEWIPTFSGAESGYVILEYIDVLGNL
jgi:hypothetical protein